MIVCAHGNVEDFCQTHDMLIVETHGGDIESYKGACRVLVTDKEMSENEYYFLKGKMLGKGIELISVWHKDDKLLTGFLAYQTKQRKEKYGGRQAFGFRRQNGVVVPSEDYAVALRILELRDKGRTLREIRADEGVHHSDGRKISISTIQQIIKNRKRYE